MTEAPAISLFQGSEPGRCPRIKVCGFTRPEGLAAAMDAGVDAVGLNFWPGSKRFVAPAIASSWLPDLPPLSGPLLRVGVFVNPTDAEVLGVWESGLIAVAQLHGDEPAAQCARLMAAGLPVIKAFGWHGPDSLAAAVACGTSAILADAYAPGEFGGTGHAFDWGGLRAAMDAMPCPPLVLSGGLTPGNVVEAIAAVRPAMIDVASGVESAPGIKDAAKIRALVAAVRGLNH